MAEERAKRKLSAILSADVKGYSRLMGEDELATIETLKNYREIMATLINKFQGRVVDSPGDNVLAEFSSVIDALECSVEIQKELKQKNEQLPETRRMEFRIGVNLGDVVEDGERIYGDGVNIAARVESLAEGGRICISGTAFDQVGRKLPLGYEYLGEQTVKNIENPVRVYRVLIEPEAVGRVIDQERPRPRPRRYVVTATVVVLVLVAAALTVWNFYFRAPRIEPASIERMAFPLPDKPSIAVLPFVNMSEDPKQEYFSDGLTDQIINSLSKIPYLFVIARNSTFTYKGKPVKVQKVAEDLGVQYVLEGSVQRSSDRVRITAQLVDAITGRHKWSERYDRDLEHIFAIQDDITIAITKAMNIELGEGEQARLWQKGTTNLKAYLKYLEGVSYLDRLTKKDNTRAQQLFEEALVIDPGYAVAYVTLGWVHWYDARYGWVESRNKSIETAYKYAQKAIELDDTLDMAHLLTGGVYLVKRQQEKNVAQAERALAINPNGAVNNMYMAGALGCTGRWEESLGYAEKAMRLAPFPPVWFFWVLGRSYFMTDQYDKAIETFTKAVHVSPDYLVAHAFLAASYSSLDRQAEAEAAAEQVLRINPKFNLESYAKTSLPYKNKADIERYIAALRKAGLPQTPPLPLPDKPSIAVLPFVNMSGDPEQEYFSDGITEAIITALTKVEKLFVIARNSTFTYKGKPVKVQQVAQDLGVQYVLEGSVQKSADRIRITAQLIEAPKGHHLWAERYDRHLKDLFALQDEITMKIITALEVKLTEGEQALVAGSGTDNLDAYLKILQARDLKRHQNIENNRKARRLVEEAIKLDPDYAQAYRWLSGTHLMDVWLGSTKSPRESLRTAMEFAKKALSLDDSLGGAHGLLGNIYIMRKEYEKGIREAERAVELEPNGADAHAFLGMGLRFADRAEEAIPILKKAIRLDPHAPEWYLHVLAGAYREIEKYEKAIVWGERAVQQNPKNVLSRVMLCSIYSMAGRMDEARAQAKEIMRLNPNISVERIARTDPQKNQVLKKRYIDALRKAGLK